MEEVVYSKIVRYLQMGKRFNKREKAITSDNTRYWDEKFSKFSLEEEKNLMLGSFYVPTFKQAEDCLKAVHVSKSGKHIYQEKLLYDALMEKEFTLPSFTDGLSLSKYTNHHIINSTV